MTEPRSALWHLRDEAIEILLQRVEGSVDGRLRIAVEGGYFIASFDDGRLAVRGEHSSVMSDALNSLIERLDD